MHSIYQYAIIVLTSSIPIFYIAYFYLNHSRMNVLHPIFLYSIIYFIVYGMPFFMDKTNKNNVILFLCILLGNIAIVLGYISSYLIGYNNRKYFNSLKMSKKYAKIIFLIGFIAFCLYIFKIGNFPILSKNLEQSRVDSANSGGALLRIFTYFLIIAAIISFGNYANSKAINRHYRWKSSYIYFISIISLLLLGNRSPVFNILMNSFFLFLLLAYEGKVKKKIFIKISIIGTICLVLFVGGYGMLRILRTDDIIKFPEFQYYIKNKNYIGFIMYVFFHYLGIGYYNFIDVLSIFPNKIQFQHGLSYIQPIITILPGTQYTLDMQIKIALNQKYLGGGTIPSVLGESYANFGILGTFYIPFIIMFTMHRLYYMYLANRNNILIVITYVYCLLYFSLSILSGLLATSIFPFIALFLFITYFFLTRTNYNA